MPFREELGDHHERLLAIAMKAEDLVGQPLSPDLITDLANLRATMFEALGAYQGFVHREVHEEAKRIGEAERSKHAAALKAACIALSFQYQSFAMRWAERSVSESWPEYRLSALKIISAVRDHVRDCP